MRSNDRRQGFYKTLVALPGAEIYRFAFRLCGHAETAEDLCQETFFEAWRSLSALRETKKARAWLFEILRYRYAHWVRDSRRQPQLAALPEDLDEIVGSIGPGFDEQIDREQLLQRALGALSDCYKVPLLKVLLEGKSCRETADAFALPMGTVLSRVHRARLVLRKYLRDADGEAVGREASPAAKPRTLPFGEPRRATGRRQ